MLNPSLEKKLGYKKLPDTPGVYLMKDGEGNILYVGKAGNLRRRVSSYFERPHDVRIQMLVSKIQKIDHRKTDTALEALILEAELIKTHTPPFNVREKDDKSFLYIEITRDLFPRVLLVRGKDAERGKRYGPFTSASSVREALHILRRIFPWNTHPPQDVGTCKRPCFDYEVGLCPGTCVGLVTREEYGKEVERLKLFFDGKKKKVIGSFEKEMKEASKSLNFEKAEKIRRQLFALKHIRDTAFIRDSEVVTPPLTTTESQAPYRIEGYDISNISGASAVGSMVVFEDGKPNRNEYRKFRIKTIFQPNDVGMLTEVLTRRFGRHVARKGVDIAGAEWDRNVVAEDGTVQPDAWALPNLILIDGGLAQANAAKKVLLRAGLRIPILGIAKGSERKRNDIIGAMPKGVSKETLIRVRNEAHRFAITYHKALRGRRALE